MIKHDVAQRSADWFALRCGRLTSSAAAEMLSQPPKGKPETAGRRNLRVRLALEQVTGTPQERAFTPTQAMERGVEREADALATYEAYSGYMVRRCGFVAHDDLMAGTSLDAYTGNLGVQCLVVEVKCPMAATHLETLRTETIPEEYRKQLLHHAWIAGTRTGEFVSYCPEFPEELRLVTIPVTFGRSDIEDYEVEVRRFLAEVAVLVDEIRSLRSR